MKKQRRNFIRQVGLVGGSSLLGGATLAAALPEPQATIKKPESEEDRFELVLLQTTDVHCQVHAHDELFWENNQAVFRKAGGYGHLATLLEEERKKHSHSFLVDTGDMFQGSELSVKTTGKALVPILDALQYDLYLPGNWEVIYYKKAMQTLLGSLKAPKVCANMFHDLGDGKKGESIFPPYHIWTVKGIKIGFLGYTDPLVPIRQSPNYSKGIVYSKPEENLAHFVDVLRNQEQCAYIVVLAHLGLSQQISLANHPSCAGVDYIFGGDTHERVRKPIVCSYSKVVEPGAFGSFVGKLTLQVENGKVVSDTYELLEVESSKFPPSSKMEALIKSAEVPFEKDLYEVLGHSTLPLYRYFVIENTIDTLVLQALKARLPKIDVVLSNGFRFCPPRVEKDATGHVPITNGFLFDMLPVDSRVRTAEVTGTQLMTWLEKELNNVFAKEATERFGGWVIKFKGMEVDFLAFGEKGKRVQSVKIGKKPLDLTATYSICACERDGDPEDMLCRIRGVKNPANTEFTLHGVLRWFLQKYSPVSPKPEQNAKALDAPATLLTQVTGVDYQFR